jgi:hypothetical protein
MRKSPDFPPGWSEILASWGCLDATASHDGSNGDVVQLWSCTGNSNQLWAYIASTGQIVNYAHRLCLDANAAGLGYGDKIQIWSCNGQAQQSWCFAYRLGPDSCSPYGNDTVVNYDDYFCLDARTPGLGDGDKVQLWSCDGRGNQDFIPFP